MEVDFIRSFTVNDLQIQCAKKVMSDILRLVDFAIGLVNFVLNLPDGQVLCFGKFKLQNNTIQFTMTSFKEGSAITYYSFLTWSPQKLQS